MLVAFIGLGNMGGQMAANLGRAGHDVIGYDITQTEIESVRIVDSIEDAVRDAEIVFTMLPNGRVLSEVAEQAIRFMRKGALLVDCSTVDVDTARSISARAKEAGLMAIDAPVSGGVAGTLTFMVGGTQTAFKTASPFLEIMGQKNVYCGEAGAGQAAKICNNMILGVTMIATCEAFALADKLGLDRQAMFDVVSTSSGYSWTMNAYCPAPGIGPKSPADNEYKPGFAAELMLKDLRLSQQAAASVDADTPMGSMAQELYADYVENDGGGNKDFSAVLLRFEQRGRA